MFRIEIQELIDMELKSYTIQEGFCHKNSNRETDSGICFEGSQKEKAIFSMVKKTHQIKSAKVKGFVFAVDFITFLFNILFQSTTHITTTNTPSCLFTNRVLEQQEHFKKYIFVMLKAFQNLKFLLIAMQKTGESLDTMGTDRIFWGP